MPEEMNELGLVSARTLESLNFLHYDWNWIASKMLQVFENSCW